MKLQDSIDSGGRALHSIHIGGVFASEDPSVVRTILGSCIAVCLRDPNRQIGGMNHFMLPIGSGSSLTPASFGIHAMELLINECMKLGADRRCFEAKVFGGGHVLKVRETDGNVPQANIEFAREFLRNEGIRVCSYDVGGYSAREVLFFTDSGRSLVRKLPATGLGSEVPRPIRTKPTPKPIEDDNVTLF